MVRPKQVWSTDITYRRLARGCASLVASIDWYARRVLSWRISHRMESVFCVECLEEAARTHGRPEMFTSDQGSQCTGVLKRDGVGISRDGRGGAFDHLFVERLWRSVTHEDVYRTGYAAMGALMIGLAQYVVCYNGERPHQSLGQQTPGVVYRTARGGGERGYIRRRGGATPCSATRHRSVRHRRRTIRSDRNNRRNGNTGAAPSSCECSRMCRVNSVEYCLDPGVHFTLPVHHFRL